MAKLSDSDRRALVLRMDGMSYKEIAQQMGITEVAVNSLLARARHKVKVLIRKVENDEHHCK